MNISKGLHKLLEVSELAEQADILIWRCIRKQADKSDFCPVMFNNYLKQILENPDDFTFALAIVEGKPIFKGDTLYGRSTKKELTILHLMDNGILQVRYEGDMGAGMVFPDDITWDTKPMLIEGKPYPKPFINIITTRGYILNHKESKLNSLVWGTEDERNQVEDAVYNLLTKEPE
jgi:hypothetical protein